MVESDKISQKQDVIIHNSDGMVSILVTMIIMSIIALIVISFAVIVRREQQLALDQQLSSQAFYAAESGINDAANAIKAGYPTNKISCGKDGTFTNPTLAPGVSYSCLLINQTPNSLEYDNISTSQSTVIPINSNSTPINSITLSWQDTTGSSSFSNCPAAGAFPVITSWSNCDAGILRIDLVPNTSFSRSALTSNTLTAFLQPESGSPGTTGSLTYNTATTSNGAIVAGSCNSSSTPKLCNVTISGLSSLGYYLRARSIYVNNSLNITAYTTGSNSPLALTGDQAQVDSTGKANDVLRRIVVRLPLNSIPPGPDFAIESGNSICKQLYIVPGQAPMTGTDPVCDVPTNASH